MLLLVQYLDDEDIPLFFCPFIPIPKHLFIHSTFAKHTAYRDRRPEGPTMLRTTTMMTMLLRMMKRYRDVVETIHICCVP